MIVFVTENLINGKLYVGQTHTDKKNYLGSGKLMHIAIKKYNKRNFKRINLSKCFSQEELDEQEIFWIDALNTLSPNGYNIENGGNGIGKLSEEQKRQVSKVHKGKIPWNQGLTKETDARILSRKHSEETKEKISAGNKNKYVSEETRKKISESRKGKKLSKEARQNISEGHKGLIPWNKGKKLSKETKMKMSEAQKGEKNHFYGKHHSEKAIRKMSEAKKEYYRKNAVNKT